MSTLPASLLLALTAHAADALNLPAGLSTWSPGTKDRTGEMFGNALTRCFGSGEPVEFALGSTVIQVTHESFPPPDGVVIVQDVTAELQDRLVADLVETFVGRITTYEFADAFPEITTVLGRFLGADAGVLLTRRRYGAEYRTHLLATGPGTPDALIEMLETSPRASEFDAVFSVSEEVAYAALHDEPVFAAHGFRSALVSPAPRQPAWLVLLFREHTDVEAWRIEIATRAREIVAEYVYAHFSYTALLKEIERRDRRFALTPTPTAIAAEDGTIVEANQAFQRLLGLRSLEPGTVWDGFFDASVEEFPVDGTPTITTFTTVEGNDGVCRVVVVRTAPNRLLAEVLDLSAETAAHRRVEELNRELAVQAETAARQGAARRRHAAAVLHNEVLQRLAAMRLITAATLTTGAVEALTTQINELTELVRTELGMLRIASALDVGFVPAVEELAVRARGTGLEVELSLAPLELAKETEELLYRAVQELLRNVVVHASARHCRVELTDVDGLAQLTVTDDGRGSAFVPGLDVQHFGLFMLDEAVSAASGSLKLHTSPDDGVTVTITLPRLPQR